jgi:light-regulated signal transduction histidine kinase (bacteriophytochrome)
MLPGSGDRILIKKVLINLFSSAVKFTKDRKSVIIEMSICRKDAKAVYCRNDNGAGFDMAYPFRIFFPKAFADSDFQF